LPQPARHNPEPSLKQRLRSPRLMLLSLAAGLVILTVLVARQGWDQVGQALMLAGWNLLWVAAYRLAPMVVDAAGWRHLISRRKVPGLARFTLYRWAAESCNTLLPAAQVGGASGQGGDAGQKQPVRQSGRSLGGGGFHRGFQHPVHFL
jgi:uncharacterized membrane protein YgcG